MRFLRWSICLTALAAVAFAAAPSAAVGAQLRPPKVTWMPGTNNFTHAHRNPTSIRWIVIHATEGSFAGTVAWLRNPASHASANFVIARDGAIAELVAKRDIAWHAGNWAVNRKSVGIEHVGITGNPAGFTGREYRASAHLAAYIARTSLMPIDREHIIGHSQVPDPTDPLLGGGIDNHTDPGRYWNWRRYLQLVRSYAFPPVRHKHVGLGVDSTTLYRRQIVFGTVPWRVHVSGPVTHVAFLVDGKVRWLDHRAPFAYAGGRGLHTELLRNGTHRLELRAYSGSGSWTRDRFTIAVHNLRLSVLLSGLRPNQEVAGTVKLQALAAGAPPRRVSLRIDGREVDHDTSTPFAFQWDTTRVADGKHVVEIVAQARGVVARSRVAVVVANVPLTVSLRGVADGQQVSGLVQLGVDVTGALARVDYLVDGQPLSSTTAAPFTATWDTINVTPGAHTISARAVTSGGRTGTAIANVVVATSSP
jgi:N-acetyl-anhydromuramyl-L-alanine amidase AmpD